MVQRNGVFFPQIDIMYAGDILTDELIIMDVAYMYNWDRVSAFYL